MLKTDLMDRITNLMDLITIYTPNKIKETNLKVNLILTNDIPIAKIP